jgi:hypothetical protein
MSKECTCTNEGYSPDCPCAFQQGGRTLHEITHETKLKPRIFGTLGQVEEAKRINERRRIEEDLLVNKQFLDEPPPLPQEERVSLSDHLPLHYSLRDDSSDSLPDLIPPPVGSNYGPRTMMISPMQPQQRKPLSATNIQTIRATEMLAENQPSLDKFEALSIGDKKLTDVYIGGFKVDVEKVAEKMREIAPLPEVKLPIIFTDRRLNFSHHFFQGLERLIGRDTVVSITAMNSYTEKLPTILMNLVEQMIWAGEEKKDSMLTLFTKTVLTSTFEIGERNDKDDDYRRIRVAANIWGFQYIESGMELKEADLRMWLSMNYNHYKLIFFNSFKDSGIPAFALEGVQARYTEGNSSSWESKKDREPVQQTELRYPSARHADPPKVHSSSTRRHRHRRHQDEDDDMFAERREMTPVRRTRRSFF